MRTLLILILLACGRLREASAQATAGDIQGMIRDSAGRGIEGASVVVRGARLQGERQTRSANDGSFRILDIPPGVVEIRITAVGYRPVLLDSAAVLLGRTLGLPPIILGTLALELEPLRVLADPLTLDAARATIGATFTQSEIQAIPAAREYTGLLATLPHINRSYNGDPVNSGGSTGLENMFFIDGANVTSPFRASRATALPSNFVRQVEVRAGGHEAQYGRALGAIVNAVTYSGTNTLELEAFAYLTHDATAAAPRALPTLRETGAMTHDIGVRVGGPIIRDRLWFASAYNSRRSRADRVIAGHGTFVDERSAHVFAMKLNWQPANHTDVELSVFGDPTVHNAVENPYSEYAPVNPDPLLRRRDDGGTTTTLRLNRRVRDWLRFELSAARQLGTERNSAATEVGAEEILLIDKVAQTIEGGVQRPTFVETDRRTISGKVTATGAAHTVVFGAEYDRLLVDRRLYSRFIERNADADYWVWFDSTGGEFRNLAPTFYLQDAWRIGSRLTITPGLRWSRQTLTGATRPVAQRFEDEWQPRLGFSFDLEDSRSHRLFGSAGRFYQQLPLNLSTMLYADYAFSISGYTVDPRSPGATPAWVVDGTTYESDFARTIPGLRPEHYDEASLGYERLLGQTARLTLRAMQRVLRSSFQLGVAGIDTLGSVLWVIGTPGKGNFDFLPSPRREYTSFEVSVDGSWSGGGYRASYVLSRTWGNYTGLFSSDNQSPDVGANFGLLVPQQSLNSTGLLPNDRTHVLKASANTSASRAWQLGAAVSGMTGTPVNRFGADSLGFGGHSFLQRRGSAGRTPFIWSTDLRVSYNLPTSSRRQSRAVLDIIGLGNTQAVVLREQRSLQQGNDPGVWVPNPNYLRPLGFQPPAFARMGIEMRF